MNNLEIVMEILQSRIPDPEIKRDLSPDSLLQDDLNLDSLDMTEIIMDIEERFEKEISYDIVHLKGDDLKNTNFVIRVRISDAESQDFKTPKDIAKYLDFATITA